MGRLWVRIALLCALSIIITVMTMVGVQNYYFAQALEQTSPLFRDAIEEIRANPNLDEAAKLELLREATRRTTEDTAAFRQYMMQLSVMLDADRRFPRLAAWISLPISLLFAGVVAYFIARPIRRVSVAAERITEGDMSVRAAPDQVWARGELAQLVYNFNAMAESLERLERERQDMIADIAHELRTPLTVLQWQIDAMREGVRPLNEISLERLDRQTQLLARLIEDLRTLSLAEAKRLSLERRALEIAPFAEQVTASFDERAAERQVHLSFASALEKGVKLEADPDRLEQVLSNLINNALRYTPEGGEVIVSVETYGDCVSISVQDTGPGLSDEALGRIFDRFYRAGERALVAEGSGLGLSIAKALVELHKGTVGVRNAPQGGAVFEVLLPSSSASLA